MHSEFLNTKFSTEIWYAPIVCIAFTFLHAGVLCRLQRATHVSVTHVGEMQTLEELELESAVGRFGDLWERAGQPESRSIPSCRWQRWRTLPSAQKPALTTKQTAYTHKQNSTHTSGGVGGECILEQ